MYFQNVRLMQLANGHLSLVTIKCNVSEVTTLSGLCSSLRVSVHNSRRRWMSCSSSDGRQQKSIGPQQLSREGAETWLWGCVNLFWIHATSNLRFCSSLWGLTWRRQQDSRTFVSGRRRETEWEISSATLAVLDSFSLRGQTCMKWCKLLSAEF